MKHSYRGGKHTPNPTWQLALGLMALLAMLGARCHAQSDESWQAMHTNLELESLTSAIDANTAMQVRGGTSNAALSACEALNEDLNRKYHEAMITAIKAMRELQAKKKQLGWRWDAVPVSSDGK